MIDEDILTKKAHKMHEEGRLFVNTIFGWKVATVCSKEFLNFHAAVFVPQYCQRQFVFD